jgi:hypothetical protein
VNPILYAVIRDLVVPEVIKLVVALHAEGVAVTESTILTQLEARGVLQRADVEAWLREHPETGDGGGFGG